MRLVTIIAFLAGSLAFTASVWWFGLGQTLGELERRGRSDLALAADRVVGQLGRYRELLVVLAQDPRLQSGELAAPDLNDLLRRAADLTGALDLVLIDAGRRPVASSSGAPPGQWIDEPFVGRALNGTLGSHHAVSREFDRRAFYFAAPLFSDPGPVVGALVIVIDIERIEAAGRGATPVIFFTDDLGVVFLSNRSELVLMQRGDRIRNDSAAYEADQLRPFVAFTERTVRGTEHWSVEAGPYVPPRALHLKRPIPVIDLTAEALVDARPAYALAGLQAAVAAAVCFVFGLVLFFTAERRRALAQANEALEERVALRTRELSTINETLREEIRERKEAEIALNRAQDELVQVGKLSALGQMSAGISHELNQPLMAIRSFAENSERFLAMGRTEQVRTNLSKISDLAGRMARIIKNLKAFARQESEPAGRVDLAAVVRAAVEVSEMALERGGVTLDLRLPPGAIWVNGGEVRLQQVLVNLITNAVDAMSERAERRLSIEVLGGATPTITVRDTGPGIADPGRIFEPFYSTKSVGNGDGTGLGLSISYGLVQSFGGNISGENHADGGAVFSVKLQPWEDEVAA